MDFPLSSAEPFRTALRAWYLLHRRKLPWRQRPSLYGTVVSEFMLQQTQVKTVLPYFERWLRELPDFAALAAAPESRVLKLWEGLGYYSRARNLQRLAQAVVAHGAPPEDAAGWRALPGVGPYTAAAVTSIALGAPEACVDGNVVRILARLVAEETEFRDSASAARAFSPLAERLLDRADPGTHNQAMMELGATVCTRAKPLCAVCPVVTVCLAGRRGDAEEFPRLAAKKWEERSVTRLWCEEAGKLLLHAAGRGARRLADIYELPSAEHAGVSSDELARASVLAVKSRTITRFRFTETIVRAELPRSSESLPGLRWVRLEELETVTLSGPHRRWIGELLSARPAAGP